MKKLGLILSVLLLITSAAKTYAQPVDISTYERKFSEPNDDTMFQKRLDNNPFDVDAIIHVATMHMTQADYDTVVIYANRLKEIGDRDDNDKARLYWSLFMGKINLICRDSKDSVAIYHNKALTLAKKLDDSYAVSCAYNGLGIHAVDVNMDYYRGLSHFRDALKAAGSREENPAAYGAALNNVAMTYYLRNDPTGLKFSQEAYHLGHESGDDYMVFGGAFTSSYMYYLLGDYDSALRFAEETMQYVDRFDIRMEIYCLYANIKAALGEDAVAERYYKLALSKSDDMPAHITTMAYHSYGSYLASKGKYSEAIPVFRKGIEISKERNNATHRYKLYKGISEAYEKTGDYRNALEFQRIYHIEADSIFNVERERSVNELMIEYEAEKRENELQANRMKLMQQQSTIYITLSILGIIFAALAATYFLYRRKNKMYLQIVRQQHEFMAKERKLEERINLPANTPVSKKEEDAEQQDFRGNGLFGELEHLMKTQHPYRDRELTIEKLAEMLGTNRTYLSKAISQQTGGYFNAYVNAYRIDEAVKALSDPDNEEPLKAIAADLGFNNLQTFYNAFKGQIGMPPSKFREKYMELYNKKIL